VPNFPANSTERNAAKIFGLLYLPAFILLAFSNFGVLEPIIGSGDPSHIAQNILSNQTNFRLACIGILLYGGSTLAISAAIYIILRPINQAFALLALLGRVVNGLIWILVVINFFTAIRVLTQPEYSGLLPNHQQALARLFLSGFDQYYVGLLFWSLSATIGAFLWLKSGFIPRTVAILGILSSAWCVVCSFALLIDPAFSKIVNLWLFDTPMVLFEITLSVLILVCTIRTKSIANAA
jgi:hypothetical protein